MKQLENIEQVFRDSLSNLEADVNPEVWNNIRQNISSSGNSGSNSLLGSLASKVIVGVLGTAAVVTAVVVLNNNGNNETPVNTKPVSITENNIKNIPPVKRNVTVSKNTNTPDVQKPVSQDEQSNHPNVVTDGEKKNVNQPEVKNDNKPEIKPENPVVKNDNKPEIIKPEIADVKPQDNPQLDNPAPNTNLGKLPVAQIVVTPGNEFAPVVVTLSNKNNDLDENVMWDFGDGSSPSMENAPVHIYEKPGKYIITLTVKDEEGNVATDYETIEVKSKPYNEPYLPNSFTPNGDGINDVYQVTDDVNIASFKIVVTDKNGKPVAQWSGFEGYWDGRNLKGEICPPGTYIYILDYTNKGGQKLRKSGTISLPINR